MIGPVAEWAKKHDISRVAAYRRLSRHQIPWNRENHTIDFEEADRIWEESRNPAKQRGGAAGGEAARQQTALFVEESQRPDEAEADTPAAASERSILGRLQIQREALRIRKEKLTVEQLERTLVSVAGVRAFEARVYSLVKSQLLNIGSELQDDLAQETDPARCREMVDARIRKALSNLAAWRPEDE